ncbi:HTH myb-type domain-containing protein [Chloropicon primus]|uniref:HTH myb-type domain-containing protein n=1 Tax=Chloropicon primus TaxID=1764295 RepID=A0A5B8MGD7_9CHLO|nr:hypothetical protein A3770_02p19190 [Chloropicon primus]UPQ98610.1 HTH myb-type domain-containing protein [Chloropicon primus]|eukprot:QDZ19401.1 hypothetical protein A3770_02p19190 [Chloropicon primus]
MMQQPLLRPGQNVMPTVLQECFDIKPVKCDQASISLQANLQAQMLSQSQLHAHAQMMNMMSHSLVHTHSLGQTMSQQTRPHRPREEDEDASMQMAMKRPRLIWTRQLHERFVEAVNKMGVDQAVPKAIMQSMNVKGITRENVASHLQKYRAQLKKRSAEAAAAAAGNKVEAKT